MRFETLLTYKDVVVLKVEPDGLRVRHSEGVRKIPYEELPESLQKFYNFKKEEAADFRMLQRWAEAEKATEERKKKILNARKVWVSGPILQVIAGKGVLLSYPRAATSRMIQRRVPYEVEVSGPTILNPKRPRIMETRYKTEQEPEQYVIGEVVFVSCPTEGLTDRSQFSGYLYSCGTFSYVTVGNFEKSVSKFTKYENEALQFLSFEE